MEMGRKGRWLMALVVAVGLSGCAKREPEPEPASALQANTYPPPPPKSKLAKVQVGMSPREVENILGPPTDENAYVTGKAFIPFYYGKDRWRRAYFYKGVGRVVFEGSGGFSQSAHVERVEYDPSEPGHSR
jgi:hypothetical protein